MGIIIQAKPINVILDKVRHVRNYNDLEPNQSNVKPVHKCCDNTRNGINPCHTDILYQPTKQRNGFRNLPTRLPVYLPNRDASQVH